MPEQPALSPDDRATLDARNRQIAAVHTISRLLSSTLDLDERLRDILTVAAEAVEAEAGTIYLHRPADNALVFQYVVGPAKQELLGYAISATDGVAGKVFGTGEPHVTNRAAQEAGHRVAEDQKTGFRTASIVTVPIKYQAGQPVGVMQILNKRGGPFDQGDLEVLEIVASIAATAIENARLHREAQLAAVAHAVGDLSHDIKNKVTPIAVSVDTLAPMLEEMYRDIDRLADVLPASESQALRQATDGVRGLYDEIFGIVRDQVQEVQDYTRLIADALKGVVAEPQLEPNEIGPIVRRQIEALDPVARKHGVRLAQEHGDVPVCRFDRFLMERAIYNLVNNAIPETPAGGTVVVRTSAQSGYLLVEVSDTGRGMPPHVMERILRGDAKSTKPGGTGLGTRIVHNAVAAHRGAFEGDSREGAGTTFRLRLPLLH